MKYAAELIGLMAPYPGRPFKMDALVRHSTGARPLTDREREAARKAVRRALQALIEAGTVQQQSDAPKSAAYEWKSGT